MVEEEMAEVEDAWQDVGLVVIKILRDLDNMI